jgi:hypothetical protein
MVMLGGGGLSQELGAGPGLLLPSRSVTRAAGPSRWTGREGRGGE